MPNIAFYANESDSNTVVNWINAETDLAYILGGGEHRWKAVPQVDAPTIYGQKLYLWHVASGPLPLCRANGLSNASIENPFEGWNEEVTGRDHKLPWFGAPYPGIFDFKIQPVSRFIKYWDKPIQPADRNTRVLGRSDFGWVGKAYKPKPETTACWKKIERFIYGRGIPVDAVGWGKPGSNPTPDSVANDRTYVALPGALAEMRSGTPWNPYP